MSARPLGPRAAALLALAVLCVVLNGNAAAQEIDGTASDRPAAELGHGIASWYGAKFHGRRTSSGERFDMNGLTAAHPTLPFGTRVRVRNALNGREVIVRITDRAGRMGHRIIDLSKAAAAELGFLKAGEAEVVLMGE